jgi:hypothetical protein
VKSNLGAPIRLGTETHRFGSQLSNLRVDFFNFIWIKKRGGHDEYLTAESEDVGIILWSGVASVVKKARCSPLEHSCNDPRI